MRGKTKILIVEDNTPLAMLMVHMLSRAGCEVQVAHTGKKSKELSLEQTFDLIALDIDFLDLDVFHICRELKQRHMARNTPIIFISGPFREEDGQNFRELDPADIIEKPLARNFVSRILSHVGQTAATMD
jgi:two-component system alkaline phosphatase synthesis response regulator PhoP